MKIQGNNFHFYLYLPDYVGHESPKEFWKNMRAGFLRMCPNSLRQTSPEMMHLQA